MAQRDKLSSHEYLYGAGLDLNNIKLLHSFPQLFETIWYISVHYFGFLSLTCTVLV